MIALIVECAVRDDDICWVRVGFRFLSSLLLRANHYQGELAGRLPNFIFFSYLFSVDRHILVSLIVSWLWTVFGVIVVNLVLRVMSTWIGIFFFFLLNNSSSSQDIETCLGLCDEFPVLMLLETDIFLFGMFLVGLVLVDWFRMHVIESFGT